ncbi:MAG: hypothetical protein WA952_07285, partial [Lewinella sp.]
MFFRLAASLLALAFASCEKDNVLLQDPPMTVSMEVQSVGGSDQYTASIRQQQVSPRRDTWNPSGERWRRNADGSIELIKQLTCTIIKPGERETELELYLA